MFLSQTVKWVKAFKWGAVFFLLILESAQSISAPQTGQNQEVGIDEKLGQIVPLDLTFVDEQGDTVTLSKFVDKPTILSLVFYRCPGICPRLLGSLSDVLSRLTLEPGKDFGVLTISFDVTDTPAASVNKKRNYLHAIGKPFPKDAWHFLVGDSANVAKITNAVGYRYKKQGDFFVHPNALFILAPDGKIIRYLFGIDYLPFDVKMALTEAAEGRVGPTISKVLLFCYSYDPEGRQYAFNITKVIGTLILFFILIFIVFLVVISRIRRKHAR